MDKNRVQKSEKTDFLGYEKYFWKRWVFEAGLENCMHTSERKGK